MNGPHDVGGRAGFGSVAPEPDEPLFHADWERRVLGVTLCCGALGYWTIDESRHARESLPPALYCSSSYYRIWLESLERLLLRHGEIVPEELDDAYPCTPGKARARRLPPEQVPATLARGAPTARDVDAAPRFAVGDTVRTVVTHVHGHTRLPGYARDKRGRVESVHEAHVLPDTCAHGAGEHPERLYTIAFDGETLWGSGGEAGLIVSIEAWESYLEPA